MKRILLLLHLGLALHGYPQQHRLDSLEKVLSRQLKEDHVRLRTLTELAKTWGTIDPHRAFDVSVQAVGLARKLGNDRGLAWAWVAQRWCLFYLGEYARCDSLIDLIEPIAHRTQDPCLIAENSWWVKSSDDWTDSTVFRRLRHRQDSGLVALRNCVDRRLRAELLFWNGRNSSFNKDAHLIEEALGLFRSMGDRSGMALCLYGLNKYAPYANDPEGRLQRVDSALTLFEADGNALGALWMNGNLVWMRSEMADHVAAVRHGQKELDLARSLALDEYIGMAHADLSDVYIAIGDYRRAKDIGLESLRQIKNTDWRSWAFNNVGRSYLLLDQPDSARMILERGMAANPFRGDDLRYAESRGYLAMALAQLGDTTRAFKLFTEALSVHRGRAMDYVPEAQFSLGRARILAHGSDRILGKLGSSSDQAHSEAIDLIMHALEIARTNKLLQIQQDVFFELARLHEQAGNVNKAFEYQKLFLVMKDSVLNAEKAKAVARVQSAYEEEERMAATRAEQARKDAEAADKLDGQKLLRNWSIGGAGLLALVAGVFLFQRNRTRKEKARSEEILYNVLPEEVANEIRSTGGAQSREIEQVSILFTDFKGFTELSARISRQDLMEELNACFKAFDEIIGRHAVEKIKTIGDSYMAAAGLKGVPIHAAVGAVQAALEMQAFIETRHSERSTQGRPAFRMRVGIHTGPVVAGIVGVKKFQYDIWGDTVNTASRMESSGEVGQVNISEATYTLVKDEPGLTFTARGKVQAKGKGELKMYFVTST